MSFSNTAIPGPPGLRSSLSPQHRHVQKVRFRSMAFPRKRAVTACQGCRLRKTKCGNERPQCSSCIKHNIACSYDPRLDHSSFDPATLLILDKLNETLQRLGHVETALSIQSAQTPPAILAIPEDTHPILPNTEQNVFGQAFDIDSLGPMTSFASTDCILNWPIFAGRWSQDTLFRELLMADFLSTKAGTEKSNTQHGALKKQGVNDEEIPKLVERFLELVHTKNPIFHTRELREDARRIAEDGLSWDASSCIVLLACALGAIACVFDPSSKIGELHDRTSIEDTSDCREVAEVHFQAARKRLGLLNGGIMACQCHTLTAIYFMYTMRPLQGWYAIHQAANVYSTYLKAQAAVREASHSAHYHFSASERRLEQRLYWTVLKSECELREELDLPQSDLCTLEYSYVFPSPTTPSSPVQSPEDTFRITTPASTTPTSLQIFSTSSSSFHRPEEQSWFYYLSEIALRRIENRVLNGFYKKDISSWLHSGIESMLSFARDIEDQLGTWRSCLPSAIHFDDDSPEESFDELRLMTLGRLKIIWALLYRPFLFYVIHCAPPQNHDPSLDAFVKKALDVCLSLNTGSGLTHRHHGTWFGLRENVSSVLMLLAARMKGIITTVSPSPSGQGLQENEYGRAIRVCLEKMRYWEAESPDIAKGRQVIEELLSSF